MIRFDSSILLFCFLTLISCGDNSTKRQRLSDVQRTGVETFVEGEEIPHSALSSPDGEEVDIGSPGSDDFVILNFWASWCAPCVKELPSLQELSGQLRHKGVRVITINIDPPGSREDVRVLLGKMKFELPVVWDPELVYVEKYRVSGFPETFFISKGKFDAIKDPVSNKNVIRIKGDRNWSSSEMMDAIRVKVAKTKGGREK